MHDLYCDYDTFPPTLKRRGGPPQVFLRDRAFSNVYGLEPPIDNGAIWAAYVGECGATAAWVVVNGGLALVGHALTPKAFEALGSGVVLGATPDTVLSISACSAALGLCCVTIALAQIFSRVVAENARRAATEKSVRFDKKRL